MAGGTKCTLCRVAEKAGTPRKRERGAGERYLITRVSLFITDIPSSQPETDPPPPPIIVIPAIPHERYSVDILECEPILLQFNVVTSRFFIVVDCHAR